MDSNSKIPQGNPKFAIEELIQRKMDNLKNIDKTKFGRYFDKESGEISDLWEIHDELSFFKEFDIMTIVQHAINAEAHRGNDQLIISLPIGDKPGSNRIAHLNLVERSLRNVR